MMDKKTIYQVDAFTDEPFKGNPAGVMIVDDGMTTENLQNIAMEMNLSETAFIIPRGNGYQIRFFTPTSEVDLCGHATLASAHILFELGLVNGTIHFNAKGADLSITKDTDWIVMDFPKYPIFGIETPERFKQIIGFEPIETYSSLYGWIIALAGSENEIIGVNPDFESMKKNGLGHLMVTAKSTTTQADFVVRCFAPSVGINEDPVTGSAHCALTPLWYQKLGKLEMDSMQLSKRSGKMHVKLVNDRVVIKGKAITIFEAKLKL